MHTTRHATRPLNPAKLTALGAVVAAFNAERRDWVNRLKPLSQLAVLAGSSLRKLRDAHIKAGYKSRYGLQARAWKLALTEAADLLDRHWQAQLVAVKDCIRQRAQFKDEERHLLYYALCGYDMIADVLGQKEPPSVTKKFGVAGVEGECEAIAPARRATLLRWLRRRLRVMLGKNNLPAVRAERSAVFDASSYKVFDHHAHWYVSLASLTPGKRITLPLLGDGAALSGNIRLVLENGRAEIHRCHTSPKGVKMPKARALKGKVAGTHSPGLAVDAGFTEVCVDQHGTVYGAGFGKLMKSASEARNAKGICRNKLRAVAAKARDKGNEAKARRIERCNLGTVKQTATLARAQKAVECHINQALNILLGGASAPPTFVVHEDLAKSSFKFKYGAAQNRTLSNWARGAFAERLEYKAQVRGSHLLAVNPAYSSQLCPICGFVDKKNRSGDRFQCLHCKHTGAADRIAAINLLARASDAEIECWMAPATVRAVLDERFNKRRLEAAEAAQAARVATVNGQVSDVVGAATRAPHSGEGRKKARLNPTTARKANNKPMAPPTVGAHGLP